jgi:hypothetical protein
MGILCSIGRHEARPSPVWNGGFYFSRCKHCETDMIGEGRGFRPVPRGYEVVWKLKRPHDIDWSRLCNSLADEVGRH